MKVLFQSTSAKKNCLQVERLLKIIIELNISRNDSDLEIAGITLIDNKWTK